jgi:murein DD-endopeptidase MepM/ murein hydrolase activator NlpD
VPSVRRVVALVGCLLLCAVAVPALAAAGSTPPAPPAPSPSPLPAPDVLAQQLQQALADQAQLQATKLALAGEVTAAEDQRNNLQTIIDANQKSIAATLTQLAAQEQIYHDASNRAAQARADAAEARRRADDEKKLLGAYLRMRYEAQDDFIAFVLSSASFSDLFARVDALGHLAESGTSLLKDIQDNEQLARIKGLLAQSSANEARAAADALAQQKADLELLVAKSKDLISQLDSSAAAANQEIANADSQGAALAQKIADLRIAELDQEILGAEQAAWDEANYYVQHHLGGLPSPPPAQTTGSVRFDWPAPGSFISQRFGPSSIPQEPPMFGIAHFHTGIDLAGPAGMPVYAAGAGIVVAATESTIGYGNHIIIAHDGHTLTLYGHLEKLGVKVGDTVSLGQPIGLMGSSGNSTGPHLHFELRIDNVPSDPYPFLPPLAPGATGPPSRPAPTATPTPTP